MKQELGLALVAHMAFEAFDFGHVQLGTLIIVSRTSCEQRANSAGHIPNNLGSAAPGKIVLHALDVGLSVPSTSSNSERTAISFSKPMDLLQIGKRA